LPFKDHHDQRFNPIGVNSLDSPPLSQEALPLSTHCPGRHYPPLTDGPIAKLRPNQTLGRSKAFRCGIREQVVEALMLQIADRLKDTQPASLQPLFDSDTSNSPTSHKDVVIRMQGAFLERCLPLNRINGRQRWLRAFTDRVVDLGSTSMLRWHSQAAPPR
jgi:hypothetical protein